MFQKGGWETLFELNLTNSKINILFRWSFMDHWGSSHCGQNFSSRFLIFFSVSPLLLTSSSTLIRWVEPRLRPNPSFFDFRISSFELLWWEIAMCARARSVSQVTINFIFFLFLRHSVSNILKHLSWYFSVSGHPSTRSTAVGNSQIDTSKGIWNLCSTFSNT